MTTTAGRRVRRILVWAFALMVATVVLLTFIWFVNPPTQEIETVQSADAVVLFVGSSERLHTAVELMEHGAAPNLVIPNGRTLDLAEDLCEQASFEVFCPDTEPISTRGEAHAIGRLAEEKGWSRLIAVTSVYHVHRATFLLRRCHDGPGGSGNAVPRLGLGGLDGQDRPQMGRVPGSDLPPTYLLMSRGTSSRVSPTRSRKRPEALLRGSQVTVRAVSV